MRVQGALHHQNYHLPGTNPIPVFPITLYHSYRTQVPNTVNHKHTQRQELRICRIPATLGSTSSKRFPSILAAAAAQPSQPLDLTEDNIRQVLADAREEFGHLFDASVGMTGTTPIFHMKNCSLFSLLFVSYSELDQLKLGMVCRTS